MFARQCQRLKPHVCSVRPPRENRAFSRAKYDADVDGIPFQPTWSVNELLSSYQKPVLSFATLKRLHELSALLPPTKETPKHLTLRREMEDLITLVEAVKLVDTNSVQIRRQHKAEEKKHDQSIADIQEREPSGESLLQHAARTSDHFYVVDADKRQ